MILAHIPTGYIVSKAFNHDRPVPLALSSLLFSCWPDLDLVFFYFFDLTKTFHHCYFPHLPVVMFIMFLVSLPLPFAFRTIRPYYWLFFINWALHLVLDSYTGGIAWLYPIREETYKLVNNIPAIHSSWVISFALHRSFLLEIAIVAVALILLIFSFSKIDKSHLVRHPCKSDYID